LCRTWFGTRWELYRYDGYVFKVFVRDAGNPNSLDGIGVRALFKDRDGALWVGCDQSLNKFDQTMETFTRYPIPLATHITQDTAGLLWVTTLGGLYRLDPASGEIQHYSHDPNDPSSLSSKNLSYCGEDKRGTFWVASNGAWTSSTVKQGRSRGILFCLMYQADLNFTKIASAYSGFFTVPPMR
jgi:ligand-binding sensor domain-containing protein